LLPGRAACANSPPLAESATARMSAAAQNFAAFANVVARTEASFSKATAAHAACALNPRQFTVRSGDHRNAKRGLKSNPSPLAPFPGDAGRRGRVRMAAVEWRGVHRGAVESSKANGRKPAKV
jgi:hypothetical protein